MNLVLIFLLLLFVLTLNFQYIYAYTIPGPYWYCIGHFDSHCSHIRYYVDPRVSRRHREVHHNHDNHDHENMKIQHSKVKNVLKWKRWVVNEDNSIEGETSRFVSFINLMQKMGKRLETRAVRPFEEKHEVYEKRVPNKPSVKG